MKTRSFIVDFVRRTVMIAAPAGTLARERMIGKCVQPVEDTWKFIYSSVKFSSVARQLNQLDTGSVVKSAVNTRRKKRDNHAFHANESE
jgi:hypothetical protein